MTAAEQTAPAVSLPPQDLTFQADLLELAAQFHDKRWTQGAISRNAKDEEVHMRDATQAKWCASGHLHKIVLQRGLHNSGLDFALLLAVERQLPPEYQTLPEWNDAPGREPEEVRELFRKAAARLRQRAAAAARAEA